MRWLDDLLRASLAYLWKNRVVASVAVPSTLVAALSAVWLHYEVSPRELFDFLARQRTERDAISSAVLEFNDKVSKYERATQQMQIDIGSYLTNLSSMNTDSANRINRYSNQQYDTIRLLHELTRDYMNIVKRNKDDEFHTNAFKDVYVAYLAILEEDTFSTRDNDELADAFKNLSDLHFKIKDIDEGIRDSFHLEVLRYLSYIAAQPDYRKILDECGVSEIPRYKSCTLDYYNREARKIRDRLKKDSDGDTYRDRYANKYWWIDFSTLIDATNKGDTKTANAAFQELSANTHQQFLFSKLEQHVNKLSDRPDTLKVWCDYLVKSGVNNLRPCRTLIGR